MSGVHVGKEDKPGYGLRHITRWAVQIVQHGANVAAKSLTRQTEGKDHSA